MFLSLLQTHVSWMPYCSMVLIFIFIFFFSSGPGELREDLREFSVSCNVSYLELLLIFFFFFLPSAGATPSLPGEILTQSYKSAGYTIAFLLNWCGLFVLGMIFPILVVNTLLSWKSLFYCVLQWRSLTLIYKYCPICFPFRRKWITSVSSYFSFSAPSVGCL